MQREDARQVRGESGEEDPRFERIFRAIKADPQNESYTQAGIDPLYTASATSRIVIIGQAPGRVAQDTRIPWNDKSGERLRDWLGMDARTFYDPAQVSIMPMDFYFPGKGRSGDLPPRKGFAEKWHPQLLGLMPDVRLTVLIGSYATRRYLGLKSSAKLTDVVRDYRSYLPERFPLVHPLAPKPDLDEEEPVVRGGRGAGAAPPCGGRAELKARPRRPHAAHGCGNRLRHGAAPVRRTCARGREAPRRSAPPRPAARERLPARRGACG